MIDEKLKLAFLLKDICNKFDQKKYRLVENKGEIFQSRFLFLYYFLLNNSSYKNRYLSILKDYFEKIERFYPGSSYYLCKSVYKNLLKNNHFYEYKDTHLNIENIKKYYKNIDYNNNFEKILNVIEFIGPDGSISCKESNNENIVCERKDKSIFEINTYENFNSIYFSSKSKVNNNFFVTICDAFIEKESSLIPAIEKAILNKKRLIVICRGITKEAAYQIKKIMLSNKTLIYVYVDKFDHNDPFKLKDLSNSLGIDMLSPEKGSVIVRDISDSTILVNNLTISRESIVFKNKNSKIIDEINKQLNDCHDKDLKLYLEKRKKRINNKIATIYIPKKNKKLIQDFKDILNSFNIILKHGLVDYNNKLNSKTCLSLANQMTKKFCKTIENIGLVVKED